MAGRSLGVVMNRVTGRMGQRPHLVRSALAIREQGGVQLPDGGRVQLEPFLLGRDERKLRVLAQRHGLTRWTTDLDSALGVDDAQITAVREKSLAAAIEAGKHVYTEKPVAGRFKGALALARMAEAAGVRHGVVHDKLYLPGLLKLKRVIDSGLLGRILSVRGEFGYWVFEGDWQSAQRQSWTYRAEDGGGIVTDMFSHWSYVLEPLSARSRR